MSLSLIGESLEAGNATLVTIYTVPAGAEAVVTHLFATNTTVGSLNFTVSVTRQSQAATVIISVNAIAAGATTSYGRGQANSIAPLTMKAGELLQIKGSGAGIMVCISGFKRT